MRSRPISAATAESIRAIVAADRRPSAWREAAVCADEGGHRGAMWSSRLTLDMASATLRRLVLAARCDVTICMIALHLSSESLRRDSGARRAGAPLGVA